MLTGTHDFAAGADLTRGGSGTRRQRAHTLYSMRVIHDAVVALHEIPVPVIAKVRGVAVGAGMSLVLACDMAVASSNARFAAIFARRGLSLDCGASWLLPRLVGLKKAKEMVFFGDDLSAADAERLGLVNLVVPGEQLEATTREWAKRLASGPTRSIGFAKRLLNRSLDADRGTSFVEEQWFVELGGGTADQQEGVAAFIERRPPEFKGY